MFDNGKIEMGLIVQKYGGTSLSDPEKIRGVARRVIRSEEEGNRLVVVVSALGDTTDNLMKLAHKVSARPAEREVDMLISTGEQVSMALLAMAIDDLGHPAISHTGTQLEIITDSTHTKAKILDINTKRIKDAIKAGKIVIVAGFQGVDLSQEITTLGRGGSDLTAVALAKALGAEVCEIYTDVEGVYTADPRIVPDAKKLDVLSYEAMLELASLGTQVLQSRSIEVAKKFDIPIHVRSSSTDKEGTWISKEVRAMEDVLVSGVTYNEDEAKVTILDVPDRPGMAAMIFRRIAEADINVDMIIQNVSKTGIGRTDVSFTVVKTDLEKTMEIMKQVSDEVGAKGAVADDGIAKVSVVGVGMRSHSGVAARMFEALASVGINIEMISTSEIKISCVIRQEDAKEAVRVIHKRFELGKPIAKPS